MNRTSSNWQLILADLALILFLVALIALIGGDADEAEAAAPTVQPDFQEPAHAIYRPAPDAPPLQDWLAQQSLDPRAMLTISVSHQPGQSDEAWASAWDLAQGARASGVAVRVVIEEGETEEILATLAFDAPSAVALAEAVDEPE